ILLVNGLLLLTQSANKNIGQANAIDANAQGPYRHGPGQLAHHARSTHSPIRPPASGTYPLSKNDSSQIIYCYLFLLSNDVIIIDNSWTRQLLYCRMTTIFR